MQKLVIDIGNTRLKAAFFEEKKMVEQAIFHHPAFDDLKSWLEKQKQPIDACILSSVADANAVLLDFLRKNSRFFMELNAETPLPIKLNYKTPTTLGKDRIAGMVGAWAIFPKKNCLVLDAGTCLKSDFISAEGHFLGGNIAPGAKMRLRSMHEQTAKLPLVEMKMPENEIGNSTETALQNGGLFGMTLEMRGMAQLMKKKYPDLLVILTGGDADFFYKPLQIKQLHLLPNLVLEGLNAVLDCNLNIKI
jgi:type III pantothenate kinase